MSHTQISMTVRATRVRTEVRASTGSARSSVSVQTAGRENSATLVSVSSSSSSLPPLGLLYTASLTFLSYAQMWTSAVGAPVRTAATVWTWSMTFTVNAPTDGRAKPAIHVSLYPSCHFSYVYELTPNIVMFACRWKSMWCQHVQ